MATEFAARTSRKPAGPVLMAAAVAVAVTIVFSAAVTAQFPESKPVDLPTGPAKMELIRQRGEALIDEIGGRRVLVYVDPETFAPAALFVNSANARLQDKEVRLDDGQVVRSGAVFGPRGARVTVERPQQVFTRWYGFALTFPGTVVFGQ